MNGLVVAGALKATYDKGRCHLYIGTSRGLNGSIPLKQLSRVSSRLWCQDWTACTARRSRSLMLCCHKGASILIAGAGGGRELETLGASVQ